MDVNIEEMSSTIRATDSRALLDPKIVEEFVQKVLKRVLATQDHEKKVQDERELKPGASARSTPNWS